MGERSSKGQPFHKKSPGQGAVPQANKKNNIRRRRDSLAAVPLFSPCGDPPATSPIFCFPSHFSIDLRGSGLFSSLYDTGYPIAFPRFKALT
jgi:hypothetical protein